MATAFFGFFFTTLHLVILSQGSLFPSKRSSADPKIVCTSEVCKKRAEEILSFVDETIDPCDDFYLYVCGKRMKQGRKITLLEQEDIIDNRMKDIFARTPNVTEAKKATEKASMMYKACIDKTHTYEEELVAVKNALEDEKLGGWPLLRNETNPFKSTEDVLLSVGLPGFLEYRIHTLRSGKNEALFLAISQPNSAFSTLSYLDGPEKPDDITQGHISLLTTAAEMLRPDLSGARLSQWVNVTTSFLLRLEQIFRTPAVSKLMRLTTIKELESEIPKFPLLKLLNKDLKKVNITYTENTKIAIDRIDVFTQSMNFILDQDPIDVFNYVGSLIALSYLKITSKKFRAAMSPILKEELGHDADADKTHSRQCYNLLTKLAPDVVTMFYITKFFQHEKRQQARHILNGIGATYYEQLKLMPWMDSKTKDTALRKLWNMEPVVAFSDGVLNETRIEMMYRWVKEISRNVSLPRIIWKFRQNKYLNVLSELKETEFSWDKETFESFSAFYSRIYNAMVISAGILDGIFFQHGLPAYLNLGSIGMVMGHEMTHGYDNNGRHYDENAVLRSWWTSYTSRQFTMKAKCFVEQYGQIFDPLANMKLDGHNTLAENIADNGGLRVAYRTYIRTEYGNPQVTLPGLEKYTPEQLFFISNAMMWCTRDTAQSIISRIKHDIHSPTKYRVNIPMKNMEEFSATFQCEPGSRMRLKDGERCVLW